MNLTASLTRRGRDLDSADRAVAEVSHLEIAGEYADRLHRRHVAMLAYVDALTERNRVAREKFNNRKRTPNVRDAIRLRTERDSTEDFLDTLIDLGPDFYTLREWLDAHQDFSLANWMYDEAEQAYQRIERLKIADRRAGINRDRY